MTNAKAVPRAEAGDRRVNNQLLAMLPPEEYARIAPQLERVSLELKQLLFDVNKPIEHVYFIEQGVASIIGMMADGTAVETATVGPEGMIGLPLFHGSDQTSSQAFCQVAGEALRMRADLFRAELARNGQLTVMLHRYSQALFTLVAQSSACNRLHSMRERCARWLLHTHDRIRRDEFQLTHQFLSQMLGVRRASVTEAVGSLQESGAITYARGNMRVLDRGRLENSACECYAIVRSEFERLLNGTGMPATRNPLDGIRTAEGNMSLVGAAVPHAGVDPDLREADPAE